MTGEHIKSRYLQQTCWIIALSFVFAVACGDKPDKPDKPDKVQSSKSVELIKPESNSAESGGGESNQALTTNQFIPATKQRAGDARAGQQALVSEPIVSCGLPLSIIKRLNLDATFTLPDRPGLAAQLPYNLNLIEDSNGVPLAASNCLTCHAAPLFGELIVGLGNEFLDIFKRKPWA